MLTALRTALYSISMATRPGALHALALGVVFLLVPSGPSLAALISVGDEIHGPDSITLDTETNLEWLDLEFSRGLSYTHVVGLYTDGTGFAGFRHATEAEVYEFFAHGGVIAPSFVVSGDPSIPSFNELMNLVTARFVDLSVTPARNSRGFSSTPLPGTEWNAVPFLREVVLPAGNYRSGSLAGILDVADEDVGHWLVRVVPEPTSAVLLLVGGSVFALRRSAMPTRATSSG